MNESKKANLSLFLKKIDESDLPPRSANLLPVDFTKNKKIVEIINKHEHDLNELEIPLFKAQIESMGLSLEVLKEISTKSHKMKEEFRKKNGGALCEYLHQYGYELGGMELKTQPPLDMCKEITVNVCKKKVCVDQPVPLTVDDTWLASGSDGKFNIVREFDRFSSGDEVYGTSKWNLTYHRKSVVHEGAINIRSSAELVEPATVRQVGLSFNTLMGASGHPDWPAVNGVFADGDKKFGLPDSWGRGKQWIAFQVSIKTPGSNWIRLIPTTNVRVLYKDTGRHYSRTTQAFTYPPDRLVNIYQNYPAGTQFLIDATLSYWIKGFGWDAGASVSYNLEIVPYMNLESCSWEYPDWVCAPVP